jgi:hypothetical protein
MITPVFTGVIKDNKEVFDQPQKYSVYKAKLEGKKFELILRKRQSKRSLAQNRYLWGVVYEIAAEYMGYPPEEKDKVHGIFKLMFLLKVDDKGRKYVESTTALNTAQFEEYVAAVKRWASNEGLYIPDPNEADY